MLSPKKVKHRKVFKGKNRGKAHRGSTISFGDYALKAVESGKLTAADKRPDNFMMRPDASCDCVS